MNPNNKAEYIQRNHDYPFTNALVFSIVMRNEELCRDILERIMPERQIKKLRLHGTETSLIQSVDSKSVRMDVLFEGGDQWVNIEMQNVNEGNLPKRCRYNQSMITLESMDKGKPYAQLPDSIVIFLCQFDFFGYGNAIYRFVSFDAEKNLPLGDGAFTIVVNSTADTTHLPNSLRNLLDYMNTMQVPIEDPGIAALDRAVHLCNMGEARREIMFWEQELADKQAISREEGLAEGHAIGLAEGRAEANRATAKKLLLRGMPPKDVAEIVNLSMDELAALSDSNE